MEDNRKQIEKALFENGLSFSHQIALKHIGSSACQVRHPKYGNHQLTRHQLKYSSGEYKNELYRDMVKALAVEIDYHGFDNSYFNMLDSINQSRIKNNLKDIVTL